MIDLFRTYGAPILLGAALIFYVLDLRADNRDLTAALAAEQAASAGLRDQAAKDARELELMREGKIKVDAIEEDQVEAELARDVRQDRQLQAIRSQVDAIQNNPVPDGTVGAELTNLLREQAAASAASLAARRGGDRGDRPADLPARGALDGGPTADPASAGRATRPDGADRGADRRVRERIDGLGRAGLAPHDRLAGGMASAERVPEATATLDAGCTLDRASGHYSAGCDAVFAWVQEIHIASEDWSFDRTGERAVRAVFDLSQFDGAAACESDGKGEVQRLIASARKAGLIRRAVIVDQVICGVVWREEIYPNTSPFRHAWSGIALGFMHDINEGWL